MTGIKENKLLELLKSFSVSEYKRFGDFVRSPYHNKSTFSVILYYYLKKYSKDFGQCSFTYEEISKQVYKDKKYNPPKIRSLVSDFVKLIEQFLIHTQLETYNTFQKVLLLYELNTRDLSKNFKTVLKETMDKQEAQFNKDEDYYYNQIFLEVESFNYNLERHHSNVDITEFQKIGENIDLFFILTKLNLFHFMFYHKLDIDVSSTYKLWLLDEILLNIENRLDIISKQHPVIYMKYLVFKTILKPEDEKYFHDLKKFAINNASNFNNVTMGYIFGALTNYCTTKCNLGIKKFKAERFKIYKILDDKKIFDSEKYINYVDFLNSVISALEYNKVSWAEYFYNKNKNRIMPELKEDTLNLSKAQILYTKKNYDEAIKFINNVSYNNHYFYLRSKMIISRIYYDKNELEPIIYIVDAAKHYIKRNKKITQMNQEAFGNFFYFIGKIINLREHIKPRVDDTREELLKVTNVSSKEWLLNKLDGIEKT
jgi:hypothetical protein